MTPEEYATEKADIIERLKSPEWGIRKLAVRDLSDLEEESENIDTFLAMAEDSNAQVREQAIIAIGKGGAGNPKASDLILNTLKDPDKVIRSRAAHAAGDLKEPRAVNELIRSLEDTSEYYNTRSASAAALGEIGDQRAFEHLVKALDDEEVPVRVSAIGGLKSLVGPKVTSYAIRALEDQDEHVRLTAIWTLMKVGTIDAIPALEKTVETDHVRTWGGVLSEEAQKAIDVLKARNDPQVLNHNMELLEDKDAEVRASAILTIHKIGDLTVLPVLEKLVQNDHAQSSTGIISRLAQNAILVIKDNNTYLLNGQK